MYLANFLKIPDKHGLEYDKGKTIIFSGNDALYDKTATTPVVSGGMQRGLLLFPLERVSQEDVGRPGTKYILTFNDVTGRRYATEFITQHKKRRGPHISLASHLPPYFLEQPANPR